MERQNVSALLSDIKIPPMFRAGQDFPNRHIDREDIPSYIKSMLAPADFSGLIKPGMEIAVTCGSRGIKNIDIIVKSICDFLRNAGAVPFVVPAMGSHGGATAAGQKELLSHYGVTEEYLGCEIRSSMETVFAGKNDEGNDVFMDKNAFNADGIIVLNRVKPHTSFRGSCESGLMKMMAIGLGKQFGADRTHEEGFSNMAKNVLLYGGTILKNAPVLFGVAILENAYDETCRLEAVKREDIPVREPELLKEAKSLMPRILVDSCDVLIIDRIGKNISGTGLDPNVAGPFGDKMEQYGLKPRALCILDLTDETDGNGYGIGAAAATTKRLYDKLDLSKMYVNSITSTALWKNRIPVVMESDADAVRVLIKCTPGVSRTAPRIVRIKDTLHLSEIMLSEAYYDEVKDIEGLRALSEPCELLFDGNGDLIPGEF